MSVGEVFKDVDGYSYRTIKVGTQVWTIDNYRGTKYHNGDSIQKATDDETYLKLGSEQTGAWCLNYNNTEQSLKYGYLYNWFAIHDKRGFAPEGWRVPNEEDWCELENYLEKELKEGQNWDNLSQMLNLSYSGSRGINGAFGGLNKSGYWWKFMPEVSSMSWGRRLQSASQRLENIDGFQRFGFAVRLIKNNT